MKIHTRLALLLAATLPVALSATSINDHNDSGRDHQFKNWNTEHRRVFKYHPSQPASISDNSVSVPDASSTVLLLGVGLGGLLLLKRKFAIQTA